MRLGDDDAGAAGGPRPVNGGLLVGAAMTQRPELFAAALPTVGVLDMLRFQLFTIGWAWTTEYGNPDDAGDFAALLRYSPLHRLRPGHGLPADPDLHGRPRRPGGAGALPEVRRRAAALPGGSGARCWSRVDTRAGHGMGKPLGALAAEYADQLAFAAAHTGLDVPAGTA